MSKPPYPNDEHPHWQAIVGIFWVIAGTASGGWGIWFVWALLTGRLS